MDLLTRKFNINNILYIYIYMLTIIYKHNKKIIYNNTVNVNTLTLYLSYIITICYVLILTR